MSSRAASHSGSWYSGDRRTLTSQLDQWLAQVPDSIEGLGSLPVSGARIVIAPYVLARAYAKTHRLIPEYLDMQDMRTPGLVPPTPTGPWICPKREPFPSR